MHRVQPLLHLICHCQRDAPGLEAVGIDAGDANPAFGHQHAAAPGLLVDAHRGRGAVLHSHGHAQLIVQPRRRTVTDLGVGDDKDRTRGLTQSLLPDAQVAQPLGPCALEELQVVGVEDHTTGIGVFPVDALKVVVAGAGCGVGCGHRL